MFRFNFTNLCSSSNSSSTTTTTTKSTNKGSSTVYTADASTTKSTPSSSSSSSSSSATSSSSSQQQKLVKPKDEVFRQEQGVNHKFSKYMSYRDPNNRHLKVSRLVFEKHKGTIGMTVGIGVVLAATVAEQWANFEEMKHNLPMKLDGRSLVI